MILHEKAEKDDPSIASLTMRRVRDEQEARRRLFRVVAFCRTDSKHANKCSQEKKSAQTQRDEMAGSGKVPKARTERERERERKHEKTQTLTTSKCVRERERERT